MKKFNPEEIKKILVINFGGIGDILLSTPALRALKKAYPWASLNLLVTRRVYSTAKALEYIDRVFCLEIPHPWQYGWYNFRTLRFLKKEKIDLALNMRTLVSWGSAWKIRLIIGLIHPKFRAGRDTAGRGKFFDFSIPEDNIGNKLEMDYDIAIAELLGARVDDRAIDFKLRPQNQEALQAVLSQHGIGDSDILVGIHPGGKLSHRWPAQNFIALLQKISQKINCKFVFTGGNDEALLAEGIIKQSGVNAINLSGKLDIETLGALLKRCRLYISNDTGPMHIAAILGTPLVAIFGPGYLARYNPSGLSRKAITLHKPIGCSPCNKVNCDSLACLRQISVEEVRDAALRLLGR